MRLVKNYTTPYGESYRGPAEVCKFHFATGPEQFGFVTNWIRDRYVGDMLAAVAAQGGKLLRIRLWEDKVPTWQTKYQGEIIADVRGEFQFRSPFPWAIALGAGLIMIAAYFLVRPVIDSVTRLAWGPAGTDGGTIGGLPWGLIAIGGLVLVGIAMTRGKKK